MRLIWPWLCALLSGGLLALAFPPSDAGGLAWMGLAPLICALWFAPRWKRWDFLRLLLLGYLTGFGYFLGCLEWLVTVTVPGWIVLCLYLAIYPALWALFVGTVARPRETADPTARPVWLRSGHNLWVAALAAAAWVGLEWIRGVVIFGGFGWNPLGVALHHNIALIQITDLTGVGGLSFLLVMVNMIIVITGKRLRMEIGRERLLRPHYDFSLTVALVALAFAYGVKQIYGPKPETTPVTVAAIQANVPILEKRDPVKEERVLTLNTDLTEKALLLKPDLLIWPEAATPRAIFSDQHNWDVVHDIAEKQAGDFLLGTVYFGPDGDFNSAALLTEHGAAAQIYNKIHLVPFGEYVPLRHSFPLFAWLVGDLVSDDFDFGKEYKVLQMEAKPVRLAALICFEDTLGELARQFALGGAQFYVTLTNDGWFLHSAASQQHLNQSVFRSAEMKLPLVRAANTGVTCLVDRFGAVQQTLVTNGNTFDAGFLYTTVDAPVNPSTTFYARHGEVFSLGCLGLGLLGTGLRLRKRK